MFNGIRVLDVHAHVSVPQATNAYATYLMSVNSPVPPPPMDEEALAASFRTHVDYIDERGIDVQLLGPRPFMMLGWMPPHLHPTWTRYVNDRIHLQCQAYPDRFVGACQLPHVSGAPDATHTLEELDRCVGELGFGATYVSPDPSGQRDTPGLHEAYWHPLYQRCEELDTPIVVHGTGSADPRLRGVPRNYQLSFVTEQYLATQFLGHGDVFDRFPGLRVVVCHCGGALNRFIPSDPHLPQRDLSNNLFFDTCALDPVFLEAAIKQRGVGQMCFGVEAPGSGRAVRPETGRPGDDLLPILDSFPWLTEDDMRRILNENPGRVCPALTKV